MMKCIGVAFYLVLLLSCASSEKTDYDSAISKPKPVAASKGNKPSRGLAGLKQSLSLKDDHVRFVIKQMKLIIKNYKKMKTRLKTIEDRLNLLLAKDLLRQNSERQASPLQSKSPVEAPTKAEPSTLENQQQVIPRTDTKSTSSVEEESSHNPSLSEKPSSLIQKKMSDEENIFQDDNGEEWGEEPLLKMPVPKSSDTEAPDQLKETSPEESQKPDPSPAISSGKLLDLEMAKKLFKSRSYENAISHFQRYRDKNPEGSHYPEATFYIGQSFKRLEMPVEAEVFFREVVQSHPDSLWALRAGKLLNKP